MEHPTRPGSGAADALSHQGLQAAGRSSPIGAAIASDADGAVRPVSHTEDIHGTPAKHFPDTQPPSSSRQAITLWNTSPAEFESNLRRALAGRLALASRTAESSEYQVSLAGNGSLMLRVESDSGKVVVEGSQQSTEGAIQLIRALDSSLAASEGGIQLLAMPKAKAGDVRRLIRAVQTPSRAPDVRQRPAGGALAMVMQDQSEPDAPQGQLPPGFPQQTPAPDPDADNAQEGTQPQPPAERPLPEGPAAPGDRLVAPVQVEIVEGLDALIIRGRPEDVKRVADLVQQIEQFSLVMEPSIEIAPLVHVEASTLATLLQDLYQQVYAAREGAVSITPLAAPNALLLIGRPESVQKMLELVEQLDQPFPPTARFRVFRLKHIPAEDAQQRITEFFTDSADTDAALAPRVFAVADFRSNSLIVRASPRDLAEAAAILARLDSGQSEAFNEVRVFPLKNSLAEVLAPILQDAVTGQMYGQRARVGAAVGAAMMQAQNYERKSTRLRLVTIGEDGRSVLSSGILTDAQVTADPRTNSLIVTAGVDSMPLLAALIRELDQPPSVESQVKVFTLVNGDATNMATMLQNIFGTAVTGTELAVRSGIVEDETSLVGLRFAVDIRTNSIIATGSVGALTVVEAVLSRLDSSDVRERRNEVYRLKNSFAPDVAAAVNQYLTSKRQVETAAPGLLSAFEQVEREVIVVPEPVTNSLIVSATPRFFNDISQLVEQLDRRPPMAMIQVIIAEVSLNDFDEFGIEMGLQDSILFDRRLATGGLAIPGALFSNTPTTGGQALTNLATGQLNSDLAFGGLVLSASSESVSVLIRALKQSQRLRVLSRPQVMTLDNQPAQIVVGEDVPFITGTTFSEFGQQNAVSYREVGLILTVTPRVSPDGLVVMEIVATNSKVGPIDEGIPVSVAGNQVIRSPRIQMISAQTVVSALDGQTVVLGGLIVEDDQSTTRRVPYLSDIPLVGNLFKYKSNSKSRKELLIIMTPRIVEGVEEAKQIAQVESARMSWCLQDVEKLHGGYGFDPFFHEPCAEGPRVIYPHLTPTIDSTSDSMLEPETTRMGPELVPAPPGSPISPMPQSQGSEGFGMPGLPEEPEDPFVEESFRPHNGFPKK
ncbi:MAG: secretin N-terminal domain-containing protein [Thermoguttaceae bacterium]|jgi:type II secretion system protein D|nr:secretin N-terminal domain-containing protein [Thermoguttaceae bacterium]